MLEGMNRRSFLQTAALGGADGMLARAQSVHDMSDEIVEFGKPVFDLHKFSSTPIKIASIELLKAGNVYLLRTRSTDGAEGIVQCKDIEDYIPILAHRVMPHFLNQDARDLEHLVDEVYVANSNYKLAGQEFWCPVAYVEQSLFDLMGKTLKKPAVGADGRGDPAQGDSGLSFGVGAGTTAEEEVEDLHSRRGGYGREGGEVQDRRAHER